MRLFRKYFFKLYHLFRFLGIFIFIFIFIPNVKAEITFEDYNPNDLSFKIQDDSCSLNLFNNHFINKVSFNPNSPGYTNNQTYSSSYLISVEPNTTYSIKTNLNTNQYQSGLAWYLFNDNSSIYTSAGFFTSSSSFTTSSNTSFVGFRIKTSYIDSPSTQYLQLFKAPYSGDNVDYEECQELPDTPVDVNVDIAQPTDTNPESIFTSFYTLYFNKLKFLNDSFLENKLFLGFIGVIVIFVILELFLKLFYGGGYGRK